MKNQRKYLIKIEGNNGISKNSLMTYGKFFYNGIDKKDIEKKIFRDSDYIKEEISVSNFKPKNIRIISIEEIIFRD